MDFETVQHEFRQARKELKTYQHHKMKSQNENGNSRRYVSSQDSLTLPEKSIKYMQDTWCTKCFEYYNQTNKIANQNSLKVIGGLYGSHIVLVCKQAQHMFTISYNRKLSPSFLSCADCKKQERIQQRRQAQQEEEIRSKLLEEKQEDLFKKAREMQDHYEWQAARS